ncbi:hypothetical protein HYH03_014968 [Edaphochlamys debaryana]|uniref:Uncharacterized protein n=1 Tax=Edaphochlamys debaryana TaxID=47281 RepID=A0A835XMX0_9CHLO|nr:hypothetical protein HYH03_014968 [Edaphochlamys debaryana]|eukprot:KAG2486390.1 hypothetical protein HYH03_014968 [Edaphochlamys debaryana]
MRAWTVSSNGLAHAEPGPLVGNARVPWVRWPPRRHPAAGPAPASLSAFARSSHTSNAPSSSTPRAAVTPSRCTGTLRLASLHLTAGAPARGGPACTAVPNRGVGCAHAGARAWPGTLPTSSVTRAPVLRAARPAPTAGAPWTGAAAAAGPTAAASALGPRAGPAPAREPPLEDQMRACSNMPDLLRLYDKTQRTAAAAGGSGGGGGGGGGGSGPAALPAAVVWGFLERAADLVALRRRKGPRARAAHRAELASLLSSACRVVLWAERLPPGRACLLLSLAVQAGRYAGAEEHLRLVAEDSLNSLERYTSGQAALAASCLAKLGFHPGSGWVEVLVEATSGRLDTWRGVDLAFLLWALAKWGARPPAVWLQEAYSAFEGCGESVTEAQLALVGWALGAGALAGWARPPASLTEHVMVEVQVRLPQMSGQGLAHVAWGLAITDTRPPGFWIQDFCGALQATFPFASSGLLFSNSLWALAGWQAAHHPGEGFLAEAARESARWLPSLDGRSLAALLAALSDLGATPPGPWVALALERAHSKLPRLDPSSAVAILWAVSRFERSRAAAAAAEGGPRHVAAVGEAAAAVAAGARLPPPRRRRLTGLDAEELVRLASGDLAALGWDLGFGSGSGSGFGADVAGAPVYAGADARGNLGVHVPPVGAAAVSGGGGGGVGSRRDASTPPHLRPPRTWLVRYTPFIQAIAHAAAADPPPAPPRPGPGPGAGGPGPGGSMGPGPQAAAPRAHTRSSPPSSLSSPSTSGPAALTFAALDANQMLDLAVALADLYVYPGDGFMRAHEARMARLAEGAAGAGAGAGSRPGAAGGWGAGRGGSGGGLSDFQRSLLAGAYAALDDTWEGYSQPKAGETY